MNDSNELYPCFSKTMPRTGSTGPDRTPSQEAFTLLELLVVMGLIVLLAGLLLPALLGAKQKAHAVVCLNNLRQWGIATHLYLAEFDNWLPQEGHPNPLLSSTNSGWYITLPRQLGLPRYHDMPWRTNAAVDPGRSLWICPANKRRSNGRNLFHYCLNQHANGTGDFNQPVQLSWIPRPATVVWLFDTKNLPAVGYWGFVHTNLHSRGAQILFLDGHAERFHQREYWDFERNRAIPNNPRLVWSPWLPAE